MHRYTDIIIVNVLVRSLSGLYTILFYHSNIITILISIEVMLLALNLLFVFESAMLDDITGQVFCLLILTVAACETAIGLALILLLYRLNTDISSMALTPSL